MAELIIRKAEEKDASPIADIEALCFAEPWSLDAVYHDIVENKLAFYVVAEINGKVVGYAGLWNIVGEGHITNVAVDPTHRRMKIASAMLKTLVEVTNTQGIDSYTLEVRVSNHSAIALYKQYGFKEAGIRKGYYQDNGEDALIMWRK